MRLFHAGYLDRPRAQLDRFPTSGSAHFIYALADSGMRLLKDEDGVEFRNAEWSRRIVRRGRPFIEHQIEIVNFQVALQRAVAQRKDVRLIPAEDMNTAASCQPMPTGGAPFALRSKLPHRGKVREISVVPDLVFRLQPPKAVRGTFMVEIDRGTMPVRRSDAEQTSFEGKMRVYLAAHAAKQHERQFGWKNFRVLTVTRDWQRMQSMKEALSGLRVPRSQGASLFLFATFDDLRAGDLLAYQWVDVAGNATHLI